MHCATVYLGGIRKYSHLIQPRSSMSAQRILVPLRRLWVWYDGVLERRPLVTQAISTGVICGIGDVIAQELIERKGWEKYDIRRTAKFSMIGLLFIVSGLQWQFMCCAYLLT